MTDIAASVLAKLKNKSKKEGIVTFPLEFRAGAIPSPAPSIRRIYPPWRFPFSSVSEIKVN